MKILLGFIVTLHALYATTQYTADIKTYDFPDISETHSFSEAIQKESRKRFFAPWDTEYVSPFLLETIAKSFLEKKLFGYNLHLFKDTKTILDNAYRGVIRKQKGIITKTTSWRAFPYAYPVFEDPSKAGNGYPFDLFQYARLSPGRPVQILRYSKDREWVLVSLDGTCGWTYTKHVAVIDKKTERFLRQASLGVVKKDKSSVFAKTVFLDQVYAGTWLYYDKEKILWPSRRLDGYVQFHHVSVKNSHPSFLKFTPLEIRSLRHELSKSIYDWGAKYDGRDCSVMTKDFFACFGIFLPRNSKAQIEAFHAIPFETIEKFKQHAIPYQTLLYHEGHIGIYVGCDQAGQPLMWHLRWALKTDGGKGRALIGKTVVTRLDYWKSVPNADPIDMKFFSVLK